MKLFHFVNKINLIIFLKPKLISADAILPLVLEIRNKFPSISCHFLVPNDSWPNKAFENGKRTYSVLKRNKVLWDLMLKEGTIRISWQDKNLYKPKWLNLVMRILEICYLSLFILLSKRCYIIHFGGLNHFPFSLFIRLCKIKGKSFYSEGTKYMGRRFYEIEEKQKGKLDSFSDAKGDISISFSPLHFEKTPLKIKYFLGCSNRFPLWDNYISSQSQAFFNHFFNNNVDLKSKKIILYCLSIVDYQDGYGDDELKYGKWGMNKLFLETMEILYEYRNEIIVFLKPHYITNMEYVKKVLTKYPMHNFFITHMHPAIILKRADAQISNGFSTTLWDGKMSGVPTIEYSNYSGKLLNLLKDDSFEPQAVDIFINDSKEELRATLRDIVREKKCLIIQNKELLQYDLSFIEKEIG